MERRISTALGLGLALCMVLAGIVAATPVNMMIVSDTSVMAYGPLTSYAGPGDSAWGTGAPAVAAWVHPSWPVISGAAWISTDQFVEEWIEDSWRLFRKTFELCPGAYNTSASVLVATSDNAERVWFNGSDVGEYGEVEGAYYDNGEWGHLIDYTLPSPHPGVNTLDFIVRNYACFYPTRTGSYSCTSAEPWKQNPTGLIFKVDVTYDCPIYLTIDIKPGSDPNCFNNDDHGVIPVAILGSADFDVTQINPETVQLAGLLVKAVGKSNKLLAHVEDVNGDGFNDLVVQIQDADGTWSAGTSLADVTGALYDGTPVFGQDYVCITQ